MQTTRRSSSPQRPAEKRLEALRRQRHEPPRNCAARRRPLGHVDRHRVQRARVPARRHPGGDRGQRVLVQRVRDRCPLEAHQRYLAVRAPHPEPRHLDLPPAERHRTLDTPAAPRGPLDLVAPLRATQYCPVRLHHRLQDLQPRRDAQAVERFSDTVHHAEHRPRHLNRDGSGVGGLAGSLPRVMLRHGGLPLDSHQLKTNSVRDIPDRCLVGVRLMATTSGIRDLKAAVSRGSEYFSAGDPMDVAYIGTTLRDFLRDAVAEIKRKFLAEHDVDRDKTPIVVHYTSLRTLFSMLHGGAELLLGQTPVDLGGDAGGSAPHREGEPASHAQGPAGPVTEAYASATAHGNGRDVDRPSLPAVVRLR